MKKPKILNTYIIAILLFFAIFTNSFAYTNQSNMGDANTLTKVIQYIELFRGMGEGAVFTIDRDIIHYNETFFDTERDYHGISIADKLKSNAALAESIKKNDPIGIQIMYEHNPSVYRNAPQTSSLNGQWFNATLTFDAQRNKWKIQSSVLFSEPGDDKRGDWKIYLRARDYTTKPLFDQYATGSANFRVHKAPVPKFTFTETSTTATLTDQGSYDEDGSYKGLQGNYATDKGIVKYEWAAKVGEQWIELTSANSTISNGGKTVTFNKNGKAVLDYRLTVTDYDGAQTSLSKGSLIFDKPIANFEYRVANTKTDYVYEGNAGHEIVSVHPLISWNDSAYSNPPYTTSGKWKTTWTGFKSSGNVIQTTTGAINNTTSVNTATNNYNTSLNANWVTFTNNNKTITTELDVVNAYDLAHSVAKNLSVYPISITNTTTTKAGETGFYHCGFLIGKDASLKANITIPVGANRDDLLVRVQSSELGLSNTTMTLTNASTNEFTVTKTIPNNVRNSFTYTFQVVSRRTNTIIATAGPYTALVHTPLGVEYDREYQLIPDSTRTGRLNGSRVTPEITTDEKFHVELTTYEYAQTVNAIFEYNVKDAATGVLYTAGSKVPLNKTSDTGTSRKWEREFIYPTEGVESTGASEIMTNITFEAISENNRDIERDRLNFKLLSYKLENFRVVQIKDLQLDSFYKNQATGKYSDVIFNVNKMGIDGLSFSPFPISSLSKGYFFEFEIDSRNFNKDVDTIVITPTFYSISGSSRASDPKLAYWVDSNKVVHSIGTGSHAAYNRIVLTKNDRTATGSLTATWRGKYFIPGTTFLTNQGTTTATAKANELKTDIIVNFQIEGLKDGVSKFNYNLKQWPIERTTIKNPYLIGDVIRYGAHTNIEDLEIVRPR